MKKVFNILRRVVASVWMPPVALVGIVLAIFVEDVLWSKYPALLVRCMLACEWIVSKHLGFILILVSAISAVLFFCDLARKKWRRALARVGLFAVGFATMWWIGDCYIHNFRGHQVPTIEICVAGKDTATIGEKDFSPDELFEILRTIDKRRLTNSIAFVIGEDIGFKDFRSNYLNQCSKAGILYLAFRMGDGNWRFYHIDPWDLLGRHRQNDLKIAAVRIGEGGALSFEDDYRCYVEEYEDGTTNLGQQNLFNDSESAIFGDGMSERYGAAAVVVNSDCRISLVAACVKRLNEAGFHYVFVLYT
jgi:hypothetical protein